MSRKAGLLFSDGPNVDWLSCFLVWLKPSWVPGSVETGDCSWALVARELGCERTEEEDDDRLWVKFTMQGLPT